MAILRPDATTAFGGVTVNEYLLTKHNPNHIDMPSVSMAGKIIPLSYTIQTLCYAVCYFHSCSTHKIKKYRPIGCRPVRRFHYFYSGNGSDLQLFVYVCHVLQNLLQRGFFGVWFWFIRLRCFREAI